MKITQENRSKKKQMGLYQIKKSVHQKRDNDENKKDTQVLEKIFAPQTFDKGQICKI